MGAGARLSRRGFLATGLAAASGPLLAQVPAVGLLAAATPEPAERLRALFADSFARRVKRSPLMQAAMGVVGDRDRWDDASEGHAEEDAAFVRDDPRCLRRIDPAALPADTVLDYRLFEYECEQHLQRHRWRGLHYPVCQMRGPQRTVPQTLIDRHPIADREDARAYVARLHGVEAYLATLVERLSQQEAAGVLPPRFAFAPVVATCERLLQGAPFAGPGDNVLLTDFKGKLKAAGLEGDAGLLREAQAGLLGGYARGFGRLITWLRGAERRTQATDGVWSLPDGDAYYADMLRIETTLPVDADTVHAIGLQEVERLHGEMTQVMRLTGFRGPLPAFFALLRTDPRFRYPDTDAGRAAYLQEAEAVMDAAAARLDDMTGHRPAAGLVVRRVEPWLEVSAGIAGYFPPSDDGTRPGMVRYNLRNMANLPRHELSALAYHEGIPGHHLERAVARTLRELPDFRRHGGYTAFSEGWAMYAEQLPAELGLYQDPYQAFGRLSSELMRAGRLVVDTGLHAKRWRCEQALQWLAHNTPDGADANAIAVRRYLVTPGQATSYQMGKRTLLSLRDQTQQTLGARYRLRDFNDAVLGQGPLPMPLLARQLEHWMTARARRTA